MNKLIVFALLFFVSCKSDFEEKRIELSKEVRQKFSNELKPLPAISYTKLFGSIPNQDRLELGRMLFNDPILSRNNDVSCATCHLTNHGFADGNSLPVGSMGKGGPSGDSVGNSFGQGVLNTHRALGDDGFGFNAQNFMFRNSLSTVNVAYRMNGLIDEGLFWDGRFGKLTFQALLPIHTAEELCGPNPVPNIDFANYLFGENGPIFKGPIHVKHSHSYNKVTGEDTGSFNYKAEDIVKIPMKRPNGLLSVPTRNECTALMVAKLKLVPQYRELFKKSFRDGEIDGNNVALALASFMATHVSKNTPYDRFVKGENSLSVSQLKGLAIFSTEIGKSFELGGEKFVGGGCISCHDAPLFGGKGYYSLGVISDSRSPLAKPKDVVGSNSGFFDRKRLIRGEVPRCHIQNVTTFGNYAPDIGRAGGSFDTEDCFKFRVPPLRNVIETYPYFHHGTARAQGYQEKNLEKRARHALNSVIRYHLRGPINPTIYARKHVRKQFFDPYYQKDHLVSTFSQNFIGPEKEKISNKIFPIEMSDEQIEDIVNFISDGLYDPDAVKKGDLGNEVNHPKKVPSGFLPTITRDEGHQGELPPAR